MLIISLLPTTQNLPTSSHEITSLLIESFTLYTSLLQNVSAIHYSSFTRPLNSLHLHYISFIRTNEFTQNLMKSLYIKNIFLPLSLSLHLKVMPFYICLATIIKATWPHHRPYFSASAISLILKHKCISKLINVKSNVSSNIV